MTPGQTDSIRGRSSFRRVASCFALGVLAHAGGLSHSSADVVINEIHYDPPDNTVPAEYIELFNQGTKLFREQ